MGSRRNRNIHIILTYSYRIQLVIVDVINPVVICKTIMYILIAKVVFSVLGKGTSKIGINRIDVFVCIIFVL